MNPFGLSIDDKQVLTNLPEADLEEIAIAAERADFDLSDEERFLAEAEHIAKRAQIRRERTLFQLKALRRLELAERKKEHRSRMRFLWCVLVYFIGMDELQAGALVAATDARLSPTDVDGPGIV